MSADNVDRGHVILISTGAVVGYITVSTWSANESENKSHKSTKFR